MSASDLLDEAAQRLALALYRETALRVRDGRATGALPADGVSESLDEKLVELFGRCRGRAERMYELYAEDPVARVLVERFGLAAADLDVLLLAAACQRETHLAEALASVRPPNVEAPLHASVLASLACVELDDYNRLLHRLDSTAPLATWSLVDFGVGLPRAAPLPARAVRVPDRVFSFLANAEGEDPDLRLVLRLVPVAVDPRRTSPAFAQALAACNDSSGARLAIGLIATAGSDTLRFAAALGDELSRPTFAFDIDLAGPDPERLDARLRAAVRDVVLANGLLVLTGITRAPGDERPRRLAVVSRSLAVLGYSDPVLAVVDDKHALVGLDMDMVWVDLPIPDASARAVLLRDSLARAGLDDVPRRLDDEQIETAARLYPLPPGAIEAAARGAIRSARARISLDPSSKLDEGDLLGAVRAQLEHRMTSLADPIRQRLSFDDMVLADETMERLREIIVYVKHASTVYDRWGFASRTASRGVSALFGGPPGTGKTMAATVIASELGLELFRIDLSRVVSKYIGETESNLERVFKEAAASRAVLLFDEADALFGKRTDIKTSTDRYANMEINYLLQRVEDFDGVSILTTNKEKSMDDAFKRRIQFRLQFEQPDDDMRAVLWRKLLPLAADLADDIDFDELGRRFEIPGGNIRNAAVRAAFLAASRDQPIDMSTIVEAASRELEQMGRVMTSGRQSTL